MLARILAALVCFVACFYLVAPLVVCILLHPVPSLLLLTECHRCCAYAAVGVIAFLYNNTI